MADTAPYVYCSACAIWYKAFLGRLTSKNPAYRNRWLNKCVRCRTFHGVSPDEEQFTNPPPGAVIDVYTPVAPVPNSAATATSNDCYNCNQPGHWARDCPNKGVKRAAPEAAAAPPAKRQQPDDASTVLRQIKALLDGYFAPHP